MNRLIKIFLFGATLAFLGGCQCSPLTARYGNLIDDFSDSKLQTERFYEPGLDVSRTGMSDWRRFAWNHKLCKCNCRICRNGCYSVEYPAQYTLKFHASQNEANPASESARDEGNPRILPEQVPLPMPVAPPQVKPSR